MNVRDFCKMAEEFHGYEEEKPMEITLGFPGAGDYPDIPYDPSNSMHEAIYGRYKVMNFFALGLNEIYLQIELLPPTPVIE